MIDPSIGLASLTNTNKPIAIVAVRRIIVTMRAPALLWHIKLTCKRIARSRPLDGQATRDLIIVCYAEKLS